MSETCHVNVDSVPVLNSKSQWIEWHQQIKLALRAAGYGHLTRRVVKTVVVDTSAAAESTATTPASTGTATPEATVPPTSTPAVPLAVRYQNILTEATPPTDAAELKVWIRNQDQAVAAILGRLGGNLQTRFADESEVQVLLDKLERHLNPNANATIFDAQKLGEELREIIQELSRFGIDLPNELALAAFAQALGIDFAHLKATHFDSQVLKRLEGDTTTLISSLDDFMLAAESTEQERKRSGATSVGILYLKPSPPAKKGRPHEVNSQG
ncbi:hypothetical protein BJX70DRAFT_404766 [Aspergillus crustosus]